VKPEEIEQLGKALAEHLDGWRYEYRLWQPGQTSWEHLLVHTATGAEAGLSWRASEGPKGKLRVSPQWPQADSHQSPLGDQERAGVQGIFVSPDRPPHVLAADIRRRLLDALVPVWVEGRKQLDAHQAHEDGVAGTVASLAEYLNVEPPSGRRPNEISRKVQPPDKGLADPGVKLVGCRGQDLLLEVSGDVSLLLGDYDLVMAEEAREP
jgi:hypothetical protein